jgi:hypothetical protein
VLSPDGSVLKALTSASGRKPVPRSGRVPECSHDRRKPLSHNIGKLKQRSVGRPRYQLRERRQIVAAHWRGTALAGILRVIHSESGGPVMESVWTCAISDARNASARFKSENYVLWRGTISPFGARP